MPDFVEELARTPQKFLFSRQVSERKPIPPAEKAEFEEKKKPAIEHSMTLRACRIPFVCVLECSAPTYVGTDALGERDDAEVSAVRSMLTSTHKFVANSVRCCDLR